MRWRRAALRLLLRVALVLLLLPTGFVLLYRFVDPPVTPLMLIRLAQGYPRHQDWVPYRRIAPALPRMAIASEDEKFCAEPLGIDFAAFADQFERWMDGKRPRGASTITMQTARNLLLWPGRSLVRKALELWITPQIALLWPRQRVMEVYLNIIEFGPGLYGVQAASEAFFHKPAAADTPAEAARLIAVLPDPLDWSAAHPDAFLRDRAALIAHRAGRLGWLDHCVR